LNPFHLSASDLLVWGIVAHLVADWPLQNDWMARHKAKLGHPAGLVHAGIHAVGLILLYGWWPGLALGASHYLIDLRKPVQWWSRLVGQTQPEGLSVIPLQDESCAHAWGERRPLYDVGLEVRFWTDQVFHIACLAAAALLVAA